MLIDTTIPRYIEGLMHVHDFNLTVYQLNTSILRTVILKFLK